MSIKYSNFLQRFFSKLHFCDLNTKSCSGISLPDISTFSQHHSSLFWFRLSFSDYLKKQWVALHYKASNYIPLTSKDLQKRNPNKAWVFWFKHLFPLIRHWHVSLWIIIAYDHCLLTSLLHKTAVSF